MDVEAVTFAQALAETEDSRRNVLLGNGFSMAVHPGFGYRRLFDEALIIHPAIGPLFAGQGANFESAMGAASEADRRLIRTAFIDALAKVHPRIKALPMEARDACGQFLRTFAGLGRGSRRGAVFTTNYDLMLYWVLMRDKAALELYDGFDGNCVWDRSRVHISHVFYLHGAVHHFQSLYGFVRPKKQQWKLRGREGASLIIQVRNKLQEGHFPVFVAEGSSAEKRARIHDNPYLKRVLRSFRDACNEAGSAIFTVGHGLADVDAHIVERIGEGSANVYIGVFNDEAERRAREVAKGWAAERQAVGKPPLRVRLFPSADLPVWRSELETLSATALSIGGFPFRQSAQDER